MDAEGTLGFGQLKAGYGDAIPWGIVDEQSPWELGQGNVISFAVLVFKVNKVPETFLRN